jgi:hypothetical protein
MTPELFLTLTAALGALIVGALFAAAWRDGDLALAAIFGAVLFSLVLVVMVGVRGPLT